jgi:peroxiredoxin
MATLPRPGAPAPDFTLPSTSGTDVTLSKLRGRNVLLAFFPLAFTKVCTQEMCSFSEDYGRFRDANTEVLPISVDSIPALREFKAKERISVLIDPEGIVRWAFSEDTPGTRRENQELLAQLEAHRRSA